MTRRVRHGTFNTYFWLDCRCDPCCDAQQERVARNRAERLATGHLSHGFRSAYDAGCRCDPCKGARREAYSRLEKKT